MTITQRPKIEDVRRHVLAVLRNSPVGASTRFSLAEDLLDRYPALDRAAARALIDRALAALQDANEVVILHSESWDCSGDERVRLAQE
ncbi:MAG TPA: hypothetical protein VKF37_21015 [Chloroflexota bacterium]|nr:hypothetical protein [Chloroflexota bacterium]